MSQVMHSHWAEAHIGMPWVAGINDCWSFARRIWVTRFGWDVPAVTLDPADARATRHALGVRPEDAGWIEIVAPFEGCAVLMAKGARPCHVGVWIAPDDSAGVLHSVEGAGVIYIPPARLAGIGYRITGFYRWAA